MLFKSAVDWWYCALLALLATALAVAVNPTLLTAIGRTASALTP